MKIECHEEKGTTGAWCPFVPFLSRVVIPDMGSFSLLEGSFLVYCLLLASHKLRCCAWHMYGLLFFLM